MGEGEKQIKNKWSFKLKEDETITQIEVGGQKRAEAQAEIGTKKVVYVNHKPSLKSGER